ncbi:hypothetical protein AYI68_g2695 [Smittium mucronatum]|uniref:Uncharacterized protein n=1 Tax=Smittium mucronatum TaxID=133383 RepID=A0A1R0H1Z8_9FUNG|nr:hypothetical protein AYI68_g2695 [Smittium mucronatum]
MTASYRMIPAGKKVTKLAPLKLAAGKIDCLPAINSDIVAILKEVSPLFNPTSSMIKTDFPLQLRLNTDQLTHARIIFNSPKEIKVLKQHVKMPIKIWICSAIYINLSLNPVNSQKADLSPRFFTKFLTLNKITIRDRYRGYE